MKRFILLCLLFPLQAMSDTSLWRVSKNGSELFIGGTIHVLGKQDYPLPKEFDQAYSQADMLVFETDLNGMSKPEIQAMLAQKLMYKQGDALKQHLKPATYQALEKYLKNHKIPVDTFNQYKPSLVMMTLMIMELQRLGIAETGVDEFFNRKATEDSKPLGKLETVAKQIDVLANMGNGHEDELILSTLDDLKQLPVMMQQLKDAWRKGDLAQLESLGINPMLKDYPALYQIILVERNMSWIPQIEAMTSTPAKELILVGALHLAGKDGLLAQLRQRGYKVTQF